MKTTRAVIAKVAHHIDKVTIAHLWTNFAGEVLPAGCSEGQRKDMQKAFYAGFFECFSLQMNIIPELPDEKGAEVLERFYNEAIEFYKTLNRSGDK